MSRETNKVEAEIIDYLHRVGEGIGDKQAIIDYMALVKGYSEKYIETHLQVMARDGLLDRYGGEGRSRSTYRLPEYTGEEWV